MYTKITYILIRAELKRFLNILAVVVLCVCARAQTDDVYTGEGTGKKKDSEKRERKTSDLREKLFYGGNMNVFFTSRAAVVNLNPTLGYKITDKFQAGAGLMFTYYSANIGGQSFSTMFYGPHTFARYFLSEGIYVQVQYDKLYQPLFNYSRGTYEQGWMDYYLAGGGFMRPIGKHTFVISSIMYNFNYKANQPSAYINPLIQFGIITSL